MTMTGPWQHTEQRPASITQLMGLPLHDQGEYTPHTAYSYKCTDGKERLYVKHNNPPTVNTSATGQRD